MEANKLLNSIKLKDLGLRAFIPRNMLERKGVIKGYSVEFSMEEITTQTSSPCQITYARRLNRRRVNNVANQVEWIPSESAVISFQGSTYKETFRT